MVLATGLSLLMLGLGGLGGIINMSYAMNSMIHNTSWVTAHFHLIFGGAVVIMYFAIAYELWPRLTGRSLRSKRSARWQLWTWFWGMLITTVPWHIAGLLGQPRRAALFDYRMPAVARWATLVDISVIGGAILLVSALLLVVNLLRSHIGPRTNETALPFAIALRPSLHIAPALNSFALWNSIVLALMVAAYGYPIAQFLFVLPAHSAPAAELTRPAARAQVQ
jgi:cytochrome c oxidase subunit 1